MNGKKAKALRRQKEREEMRRVEFQKYLKGQPNNWKLLEGEG